VSTGKGDGIVCPVCASQRVAVTDSRSRGDVRWRSRRCRHCRTKFVTEERLVRVTYVGQKPEGEEKRA
jgi:transcriptional regulator NrdR family protein